MLRHKAKDLYILVQCRRKAEDNPIIIQDFRSIT